MKFKVTMIVDIPNYMFSEDLYYDEEGRNYTSVELARDFVHSSINSAISEQRIFISEVDFWKSAIKTFEVYTYRSN